MTVVRQFIRLYIVLSLFLICIFLVSSWMYVGIYVDFLLRQDYIAQNLCVNRSKPALKCGGKCYLMTKIQELSKQSFPQPKQTPAVQLINFPLFHLKPVPLVINNAFSQIFHPWEKAFGSLCALVPPSPPPKW